MNTLLQRLAFSGRLFVKENLMGESEILYFQGIHYFH